MPYRDPETRRAYDRQRKRAGRSDCPTGRPPLPPLPADYRLRKAEQVLELLQEQIQALRNDGDVSTAERARTIGFLCSTVLRASEAADLAGRVESCCDPSRRDQRTGSDCQIGKELKKGRGTRDRAEVDSRGRPGIPPCTASRCLLHVQDARQQPTLEQ